MSVITRIIRWFYTYLLIANFEFLVTDKTYTTNICNVNRIYFLINYADSKIFKVFDFFTFVDNDVVVIFLGFFFFQDDSLYIGTDYLVRQIKIINCEQYRWIDSCVKDPHCAWINNGSLLKDTSVDMEIPCYYRCRSLTFVNESGL